MSAPEADSTDNFEFPNAPDNKGRYFDEEVQRWKYHMAVLHDDMARVQNSKVIEMKWFKNANGLEHEYIVVTCHRHSEGENIYLRLERRPSSSEKDVITDKTALSPEGIKDFTKEERKSYQADVEMERKSFIKRKIVWKALQKSAPKSKNSLFSHDSVTRLSSPDPLPYETSRLIATYDNFQQPFYLRDLAFLADRVHAFHPEYQFFVRQCYWFARTIVNISVARYQPTVDCSPHFTTAGTYTPGKKKDGPAGPGILVNDDSQIDIHKIQMDFENALDAHNSQVEERYSSTKGALRDKEKELEKEKKRRQELEAQLAALMSQSQITRSLTNRSQ